MDIEARIERAFGVLLRGESAHRDRRYVGALLEPADEGAAVLAGHLDVADDDVGTTRLEHRHRLRRVARRRDVDRKSTRLNSSHLVISYAVFCLKKKK